MLPGFSLHLSRLRYGLPFDVDGASALCGVLRVPRAYPGSLVSMVRVRADAALTTVQVT